MKDENTSAASLHVRRLKGAEIALGLIDEAEATLAIRRDPALAGEVERWQLLLGRMVDELEPAEPRPEVWAMIDQVLRREHAKASRPSWLQNLLASLWFWRGLAGGSLAAATALAVLLLMRAPAPPPAERQDARAGVLVVSSLLPKEGAPIYVASFIQGGSEVVIVPAATGRLGDGIPYLWLAAAGDGEPIPLGALDRERPIRVPLPTALTGASFVVTLEPRAQLSDAGERGPVIAHGVFLTP